MLKDITLGQYFPGDSVVHRLDPRTKILLTIVYIAALFTAGNLLSYGVMILVLVTCVALTQIRVRTLMKGLKPVIFILVFTAVLNLFFTQGDPLFTLWKITVTRQGVERACLMVLRIIMLITGTLILTYTTSPLALTDALERLLGPLKKIKIPVHEFSMMMSLALRFIPTLIEETDKIMSAQKARGADFESGNLIQKARAMLPLLVPLFISAFRRADELAIAMESRCYRGDQGRTRMKQLQFCGRDFAALALGAALLGGIITLAVFGL